MKTVVIGEPSGATMETIMSVYPRPKIIAEKYINRGDIMGMGHFIGGCNMAIFKTQAAAGQFVKEDPFILEGLVKSYIIRTWTLLIQRDISRVG